MLQKTPPLPKMMTKYLTAAVVALVALLAVSAMLLAGSLLIVVRAYRDNR